MKVEMVCWRCGAGEVRAVPFTPGWFPACRETLANGNPCPGRMAEAVRA